MGRRKNPPGQRTTLQSTPPVSRPVRLVLAEDDQEMRSLVASALRHDGYQVVEARNGSELVDILGTSFLGGEGAEPIDLIISDVRMPGWNGLAVLQHLRREDWAMPFIVITAFGDEDTHREASRLGAAAVFDKPFDVDDLRTAVSNIVPPRLSC